MSKPWLWAIAGPDGLPYWSCDCVCEDREPLDEIVEQLNDDLQESGSDRRYSVVALYRRK